MMIINLNIFVPFFHFVCPMLYHFGEYNIYRYEYYYSEHEDKKYCDYKYFVCDNCISFKNKDYDSRLEYLSNQRYTVTCAIDFLSFIKNKLFDTVVPINNGTHK